MKAGGKLALTALAISLLAGCAGGHSQSHSQSSRLSPTLSPYQARWDAWLKAHPAVFHCAAQVDLLLGSDLQALESGSSGIDAQQVMVKYGMGSAIFQAWIVLHGQLVAYIDEYGTANATYVPALNERLAISTCEEYLPASDTAGAPPPQGSQQPSSPEASAVPSASYAAPTPQATGPPGCPGSAALMAVWQSAPASAFQAQGIAPDLQVTGFDDISCWDGWVVASAITNANGFAVFGTGGGLHLLSSTELAQFDQAVCAAADSPADWKNPAAGPANCG